MDDQFFVRNIVKIESQLKNGKLSVGTGFPVSSSLIATAKHVLGSDDWEDLEAVKVYFSERKKTDDQLEYSKAYSVKELAFVAEDDVDFVVLRLSEDIDISCEQNIISLARVAEGDSWSTWGFPLLGDKLGEKYPTSGNVFPVDYSSQFIPLHNKDKAYNEDEWAGLSGAPLLIDGRAYGVIVDFSNHSEGRFRAVSFNWLKQNQRFFEFYKQHIYSLDEEQRRALLAVKHNLSRLLKRCSSFADLLAENRLQKRDYKLDELVDNLLESRPLDLVREFKQILIDCVNEGRAQKTEDWLKHKVCAVEVSKWLLLLTVRVDWLASNNMRHGIHDDFGGTKEFELQAPVYGEIVISRWLLNLRNLDVNELSVVRPKEQPFTNNIFDGVNPQSVEKQSLLPIFKDMQRDCFGSFIDNDIEAMDINLEVEEMCDEIIGSVLERTSKLPSRHEFEQPPEVICYVVDKSDLRVIKNTNWLRILDEELQGKLLFVSFVKSRSKKASNEDQRQILAALKYLMALKPDAKNE